MPHLKQLSITVTHAISDRAKVLIKIAKKDVNGKEIKSEQARSKAEKHLEQIKKTSQKYHDELQGIGDDYTHL